MTKSVGDDFQMETKYSRKIHLTNYLDWVNKPDTYKRYPKAQKIQLSKKFPEKTHDIIEILKNRKSVRYFSSKDVSFVNLSFLLWASTGIQRKSKHYEFRTAPSAGALYPIETYVIVNRVEELERALYHYNIESHMLEMLKIGDFSQDLIHGALDQEMCGAAAVVLIWTGVFLRAKWKYGQRAYRYVYLDAGHIAQNLAISATSLGLGSCQIGAFFDDEINEVVNINGIDESVIYMSVVGHPKFRV
jgi:SagB-type dehydrogenase family enzyme